MAPGCGPARDHVAAMVDHEGLAGIPGSVDGDGAVVPGPFGEILVEVRAEVPVDGVADVPGPVAVGIELAVVVVVADVAVAVEVVPDHDGVPDEWETKHGLDPQHGNDLNKIMPSGYTAIEEYANELATTLIRAAP